MAGSEHCSWRRLNRPNDVVVKSDGSIYFTDPWSSPLPREQWDLTFSGVYRLSPDLGHKKNDSFSARDKQKKTTAISVNFGAFLRHWYDRRLRLGPPMWL